MWVYQETKTNAAALVPTLPEDTAGESLAEKEAMTPASGRLTEMPPQKAPRRKPFQASRDCILLAAAYLTSGQAGKAVAVLGLLAFFVACAGAWYGVLGRREEDSYRLFPDLGIGINGLLLVGFVMIYIMGW